MKQDHWRTSGRSGGQNWALPEGEKLERVMVAGLMLEASLETARWSGDPQEHRQLIKFRMRDSLVANLSGRITLDRFRTLLHRLDQWFPLYYPLMPAPAPPPEKPRPWPSGRGPGAAGASSQTPVRQRHLKDWLGKEGRQLLPHRPQRKLHAEGLQDFLQRTRGRWFRMKDMAQDFDIDGKTAWEYLQKLQEAGLLLHNGRRSAAVRYRLADTFLTVRLESLTRQVVLALAPAGLPGSRIEPLVEWLAGTAGETFWEEGWPHLAAARRQEIIDHLKDAAVLEVVYRENGQTLLRLRRQWLQE
ncbi:MAG: hypothetical protein ACLP7A_15310 [Desulfobaccales bacterium]